jgi:cytochrome P450
MLNGILNVEMPLVHMICRYLPIKRVQQIITADKVVDEYGARAFGNMRNSNGNALNLFGQILAASESDEKSSLTDGDIRSEAGNLIVAGSDTTATTLTYLVWAVLKHPQLQTQLEEEIAQLSNELSMAEMEATPILNSVIEETLRLYGAAPGGLSRNVPTQGMTVGGYHIPGGTEVSTQAYTNHRDPSIFSEPYS